MAYFDTFEEEKKKQEGQQGNEQVVSQGNRSIQSNSSGPEAAQPAKAKGSGFTNLNSYVEANEGNDGAMGRRVEDKVSTDINNASTAATTFSNDGSKQIENNTIKDNNIIESLKMNPLAIDKEQFQKQYNASYQGPNGAADIEGYQDVLSSYNKIAQNKNVADDFNDRQRLLQDVYDKGKYSKGEQRLDSFILGAGDEGVQSLQNVKQNVGNAGADWEAVLNSINDSAESARQTTQQTQADTANAYDAAVGGISSQLSALQEQANKDAAANASLFQQLEGRLNSPYINTRKKAYAELGIEPELGEFLRKEGYDLAKFTDATQSKKLGDLADANDIAKYEALLGLTDATSNFDYTKSGADGSYYKKVDDQISAASDYKQLLDDLNERQKAQSAEYEMLKAALEGNSNSLLNPLTAMGIDGNAVQTLISKGVDPTQFLTKNKVDAKSLANSKEKESWNNLMGVLGLENEIKGGTQSLYNFDKDAFEAALYRENPNDVNKPIGSDWTNVQVEKEQSPINKVIADASPGQVNNKLKKKLGW